MAVLVIGGTSGLGLELAKGFLADKQQVIVTGRQDPGQADLQFAEFDLAATQLPERLQKLLATLPPITTLVYAAGFFQDGRVTDLSEQQIEDMLDVGGRGLIYAVRAVLQKQAKLDELVTISSSSQWTPRQKEPIYNFVKAGAAHFSNAMAEDGRVGKVLVAAPAGMRTPFWDGVQRDDLDKMLDPTWVAQEITKLRMGDYRYRFAKISRDPARVEIVETR